MKVKLVSVTQSFVQTEDGNQLTPEQLLVYIARCSNPSNQFNTSTSERLLRYLIKQKHWSPFDMINITFEVVTSKAVGIQILRHWSIKPQEFSQRYAEVTEIEPIELRKAGSTNRQSSTEVFDPLVEDHYGLLNAMPVPASEMVEQVLAIVQDLYKELLDKGVAKECARMILPMATSTTLYLNGSVRSWLFYLAQRMDAHAQLEHQHVANAIAHIFREHFPHTFNAFFEEGE